MTIRRPYALALAIVFIAPVCAGLYFTLGGDSRETERIIAEKAMGYRVLRQIYENSFFTKQQPSRGRPS